MNNAWSDKIDFISQSPVKSKKQTHKYEIGSNGSPVRVFERNLSNGSSVEKLMRAPVKANYLNNQGESTSLFIVHRQPTALDEESIAELQLERLADRNQFSYDSPNKTKDLSFEN